MSREKQLILGSEITRDRCGISCFFLAFSSLIRSYLRTKYQLKSSESLQAVTSWVWRTFVSEHGSLKNYRAWVSLGKLSGLKKLPVQGNFLFFRHILQPLQRKKKEKSILCHCGVLIPTDHKMGQTNWKYWVRLKKRSQMFYFI